MAIVMPEQNSPSAASHQSRLEQFCVDYLAALNAPHRWEGKVLVAELNEEQASSLVGGMSRPLILRLVFTQRDFEQNSDVELITPGSFRLDQMIHSVTTKGSLTRQFGYTAEERSSSLPIRFAPYFFLICQLSYMSPVNHLERWIEVACDLVEGTIVPNPYQYLVPLYRSPEPPPFAILEKRKISFKQAFFTHIGNFLTKELAREDHTWAVDAHKYLAMETEEIEKYFSNLTSAAELQSQKRKPETSSEGVDTSESQAAIAEEKELRLKEALQRYTPQVIIRPITAAIIYLSAKARECFPNTLA